MLAPPVPAADDRTAQTLLVGLTDLARGASPDTVSWLVPAKTRDLSCPRERHYQPADDFRRHSIAGVRLASPGLIYKFVDDQLYAIEARLPVHEQAFERLLGAFRDTYGMPDALENWHAAPSDSFIYRHRMRMAGWFGPPQGRSIWLTSDVDGGALIVTNNALISSTPDRPPIVCAEG